MKPASPGRRHMRKILYRGRLLALASVTRTGTSSSAGVPDCDSSPDGSWYNSRREGPIVYRLGRAMYHRRWVVLAVWLGRIAGKHSIRAARRFGARRWRLQQWLERVRSGKQPADGRSRIQSQSLHYLLQPGPASDRSSFPQGHGCSPCAGGGVAVRGAHRYAGAHPASAGPAIRFG